MTKKGEGRYSIVVSNRNIDFPGEILDAIEFNVKTIVLIEDYYLPENDPESGRNVFAYDSAGNLLWRIQDSGLTAEGSRGQRIPCGFTGIWVEDGVLKAYHQKGFDFDVDPETGEISNIEFVK